MDTKWGLILNFILCVVTCTSVLVTEEMNLGEPVTAIIKAIILAVFVAGCIGLNEVQ